MGGVRKIKLTPNPDSALKTKNPDPAPKPVSLQFFDSDPALWPFLPCFYIHFIYFIPYIQNPNPTSVFPKNLSPDPKSDPKNVTL